MSTSTAVRAEHPQLVIVSSSPFGTTGPYSSFVGSHAVVYALSGQLSMCRLPGRPPLLPPGQPAFEVAAAMGAYLALVAIWNRAVVGEGDHIDLSIHEAFIQTTDTFAPGCECPWRHARDGGARSSRVPDARRARAAARRQPSPVERAARLGRRPTGAARRRRPRDLHRSTAASRRPRIDLRAALRRHDDRGDLRRGAATERPCHPGAVAARAARERTAPSTRHVRRHPRRRPTRCHAFGILGVRRSARRVPSSRPRRPRADAEAPFALPRFAVRPRAGAGQLPLAGVRVLEFTQLMAGPETGKLFRDHGADVIRIESRAFPDQSRVFGGAANMSSQFVTINRGKRSFGVDLTSEEGRRLVLELVGRERHRRREPRTRRARGPRARHRCVAAGESRRDPGEHAAVRRLRARGATGAASARTRGASAVRPGCGATPTPPPTSPRTRSSSPTSSPLGSPRSPRSPAWAPARAATSACRKPTRS